MDPKLNQCQGGGETVVACTGTHFRHTVIDSFFSAANHHSDTRLLWKLSDKAKFKNMIEEARGSSCEARGTGK